MTRERALTARLSFPIGPQERLPLLPIKYYQLSIDRIHRVAVSCSQVVPALLKTVVHHGCSVFPNGTDGSGGIEAVPLTGGVAMKRIRGSMCVCGFVLLVLAAAALFPVPQGVTSAAVLSDDELAAVAGASGRMIIDKRKECTYAAGGSGGSCGPGLSETTCSGGCLAAYCENPNTFHQTCKSGVGDCTCTFCSKTTGSRWERDDTSCDPPGCHCTQAEEHGTCTPENPAP